MDGQQDRVVAQICDEVDTKTMTQSTVGPRRPDAPKTKVRRRVRYNKTPLAAEAAAHRHKTDETGANTGA